MLGISNMDNFIVSARKYRPTTFKSVVGQQVLTQTLRNAIKTNHLAHAYLFCGPRGVGKTTCARIFAKTINCQNPTADFEACNECESCRSFNEQRSFNIHELDAASNNSVEDIRSLIEQVRIPPQIGKYSVYIIDEVHMLSASAFNALLKTLEEPPAHAIFILATTEKHKVLATILSRCQVYDFERITLADIVRHLQYVASEEHVNAEEEALAVIAQKADGGMRDALSIFDQLVSFSGGNITYRQTIEVLNVLDADYYFRLVEAVVAEDVAACLLLYDEILQKGFESQHFLAGFADHLRNIVVSKDSRTVTLLQTSDNLRKRYMEQAGVIGAQMVFDALSLINETEINFKTAHNKRLLVELMLIRLCNFSHRTQPGAPQPLRPQTAAPVSHQYSVPSAQATAPVRNTSPATPSAPPVASVSSKPSVPTISSASSVTSAGSASSMPTMEGGFAQITAMLKQDLTQTVAKPAEQKSVETEPEIAEVPVKDNPTAKLSGDNASTKPADNNNRQPLPLNKENVEKTWLTLTQLLHLDARQSTIINEASIQLPSAEQVNVVLVNQIQLGELKPHMPRIQAYLRQVFANEHIVVNYTVDTQRPTTRAYSSEDRYRLLTDQNPKIPEFVEQLGLMLQ